MKVKILYIEDEKEVREALKGFINRFASELYIAENAIIGLKLFKKYKPDIIISDINMPKMNGIDMLRNIREIDKEVIVLLTTAHRECEYFWDSIELGVNSYIFKPINLKKLKSKIEEFSIEIKAKHRIRKMETFINKLETLENIHLIKTELQNLKK